MSNFQLCKDTCQNFTGGHAIFRCRFIDKMQLLLVNAEWFLNSIILIVREYGKWVARNPIKVLCSSSAIVLLHCLGLISFNVETRPEKVRLAFEEFSQIM